MMMLVPALLAVVTVIVQTSPVTGCCSMEMLCDKVDEAVNATEKNSEAIMSVEKKVDGIDKKVDSNLIYTRFHATLLVIDRTKFDVSMLYKDRFYLASKQVEAFNLENANKQCKYYGGYLLEIDDNDERMFTWNFAVAIGNAPHFATGGNDEAQEDVWVYYHSQKPVPKDLEWLPGRPNNVGGNEDCLAFWMSQGGLNDIPCYDDVKYICEIPLVDEPAPPPPPVLTSTVVGPSS